MNAQLLLSPSAGLKVLRPRPYSRVLILLLVFVLAPSTLFGQNKQDLEQQYRSLEAQYEQASEAYKTNPNADTRVEKDQAKEAFKRFYYDNESALQDLVTSTPSPAKTMLVGGPDAFGYTFDDDTEPGGPGFHFIDLSVSPTATPYILGDDWGTGAIPIGFNFNFYGTDYNQFYGSSNGYLTFDPTDQTDFTNDPIPSATDPDAFVAPYWDDLHQQFLPSFSESFLGTCPTPVGGSNTCAIYQWNNIEYFGGGLAGTFEAVLYDNGNILFQYDQINDAGWATIGLENQVGTDGLAYGGGVVDGRAIGFRHPAAPPFGPFGLLGDTNNGGTVTFQDGIDLFYLVINRGNPPGSGLYPLNVDVNNDGVVDMLDAMAIIWYVVYNYNCWPGTPGCQLTFPWAGKTGGADFALLSPEATEAPGTFDLPIHLVSGTPSAFAFNVTYDPSEITILNIESVLPNSWTLHEGDQDGQLMILAAGNTVLTEGAVASVKVALVNEITSSSIDVEAILTDGTTKDLGSVNINEIPGEYVLEQNYPNPFNPTTQIQYSLPKASEVELVVYDQLGHEVTRLVSGQQEAGYYTVTFDAANLASGMYIYSLHAGSVEITRRMLLVK